MNILERFMSEDGSIKYLFRTKQGHFCEAIYYRLPPKNDVPYHRYHICISSQSGCKMACSFCATGKQGFNANLSDKEMAAEINLIRDDIMAQGIEMPETGYSAVVMGMGEPFDNFANLKKFCERMVGQNDGLEKIAVSSVGITPKISNLADIQNEHKNIRFFVSLHSPYNNQRTKLIPMNKKYPIEELLASCREYSDKTGTKVTLSYMLIDGVNDTEQHANDLVKLIDPRYFDVQVLLYNDAERETLCRPDDNKALMFHKSLVKSGIASVVRISKGQDIGGGCGQLARTHKVKQR